MALLGMILLCTMLRGQTTFQKEIGMSGTFAFEAGCKTSDGNFVLGMIKGDTLGVLKFGPQGDTLWTAFYSNDRIFSLTALKETKDKGLLAVGSRIQTNPGNFQYGSFILKLDSAGNYEWSRGVYSPQTNISFYDLAVAPDSGFAVCGLWLNNNHFRGYVAEFSDSGDFLWGKITSTGSVHYRTVEYSPDATVVAAGDESNATEIVKFDRSGNRLWIRYGPSNLNGCEEDILILDSGKIITSGWHRSSNGTIQTIVQAYSPYGIVLYNYEYLDSIYQFGHNLELGSDGNIYLMGEMSTVDSLNKDITVLRLDTNGTLLKAESYGFENRYARMKGGFLSVDGRVVIYGGSRSGSLLVLDTTFNVTCSSGPLTYSRQTYTRVGANPPMPFSHTPTVTPITFTKQYLQMTDSIYCLDHNCQVAASITASNTQACLGDTLAFYNASLQSQQHSWLENGIPLAAGDTLYRTWSNPGTYEITLAAEENPNCRDSISMTITVHPDPGVSFSGLQPAYTTNDQPDTLVGMPSGGVFSSPVNGSVFAPSLLAPNSYWISYTYTDMNGCTALDSQLTVVSLFVSSDAPRGFQEPYPTAFQSRIVIPQLPQNAEIRLLDAKGKTILNTKSRGGDEELKVSGLSQGLYFLQIKTGEQSFTQKMIKME